MEERDEVQGKKEKKYIFGDMIPLQRLDINY